jgi:DNA-binding winged helix-turn-helix (wHTH) protein/tetratricopeptide (TPR) repeat protein
LVATLSALVGIDNRQHPGSGRGDGEDVTCSFGGLRLEVDGTLWRGEAQVHLPARELEALRLLVTHAGQVVSPAQLKQALWGDAQTAADSVPKCLSSLRARLEPDACIQTVYKRGYRFSAEIARRRAGPAGRLPRLAIMPFATRSLTPEHLGPAIAEEAIANLARAHQPPVAVLARDSVFLLTQRGLTAQQIGLELRANLVLTGSLHACCFHYRLRVEMIRVEDGAHIWVEDLLAPRDRPDILERELMHRMAWRLGFGSLEPKVSRSTQNGLEIAAAAESEVCEERQAEAYEIYLCGHCDWQTLHRHRMQDGLQQLLRALELDPSLIPAKVDLAHLCITQAIYGFMSPAASAEYVHRAADSIPDLTRRAEALLPALGWVSFHFDHNLPAALWAFSSSAHLAHDPWITRARTMFALSRHRFAEAIARLRAAIELDPFSPWLQSRLAWALHLDGQAAESLKQIQKALALFPSHEGIGLYGALILAFNGEAKRAVELARELARRQPDFDPAIAVHAYALACAGRKNEAGELLAHLQWLGRERYLDRCYIPAIHLALGDPATALAELRAVGEARSPGFFQMLADPRLNLLHGHPEFQPMQSILTAMEDEAALEAESEFIDPDRY